MKSPITVMSLRGTRIVPNDIYGAVPTVPKSKKTIDERAASILAAYPCQYRGEQIRIEKKRGNCSCSSSPVHQCSQVGECSLWKFSQTQEMACCQRCEVRAVNQ